MENLGLETYITIKFVITSISEIYIQWNLVLTNSVISNTRLYRTLGYNEHSVITNKIFSPRWSVYYINQPSCNKPRL